MPDVPVIRLDATLDRATVGGTVALIHEAIAGSPGSMVVDLGRVERFDSAGLGGIVEGLRGAREAGVDVRLRGLSQPMLDFFSLVSVERLTAQPAAREPVDLVRRVGGAVMPLLDAFAAIGSTGLRTLLAITVGPMRGRPIRIDRTTLELDHAANGALPIVALIAFLLGLVLAMQAWVQLRVWGAEIYVADMVGVSVLTEIGPLMTAIVLAARSGSSNAAQLGAMVVGEEVDALRQMGVDPLRFLVVPKVIALGLAVLGLGIVFDVVAICGGALFAWGVAGIEPAAFREQLQTALRMSDFLVASAKCVTFGLCVGVVGCALGLRVEGGSEGVGRATTNAVVLGIFLVIVVDTLFVTAQRMVLA
ncbi:MAG: ABC transporter permease [Planctomycetes bacterium]|nr:ABC transporter permease [Planctomycetota bacterium]